MPRLAEESALRAFGGAEGLAGTGPHLPRPTRLDAAVETLEGVGKKAGESLRALGLTTLRDLVLSPPWRYEPPAPRATIAALRTGQEATISCTVERIGARRAGRRRLTIVEAVVRDDTGTLPAVWFNQEWLVRRLGPGSELVLRGAIERGGFVVRDYELTDATRMALPAPVYHASAALSAKRIRDLVERVLTLVRDVPDPLPAELRARLGLPLKADALAVLHQPRSEEEAERGRLRLAFEELLALQLWLARRREERHGAVAPGLGAPADLAARYRGVLPFTLTAAQEQAIADIDRDLTGTTPMERLLQGDVGSGKTVVALYSLLRAVEHGHQGALMAPTETLAEQHFLTIEGFCTALGVSCLLLTSSLSAREHAAGRRALAEGAAGIAVGTHALIQEGVAFRSLAVAVVDEQHRFGVEQRAALASDAERVPHRLHMTATPIPRTLALTLYGDLSVSEIALPPAGRKPVVTRWVTHERSSEAYTRLRRHLEAGRQAYVVCPLVSPSEAIEARAAEEEAARLRRAELQGFEVGCLHGQLRPAERRAIMDAFARGEIDVLVATTVIEVGVDVPNATIMIVQEADRFGLAQLHQLRGRVGRGEEQSYCLLVSRPKEDLTDAACERLQALVDTTDGFVLAEEDLRLRRAGQLLGTRQTGLSDLVFTRLPRDKGLLEEARRCAQELVDDDGPLLDEVEERFGDADRRGLA